MPTKPRLISDTDLLRGLGYMSLILGAASVFLFAANVRAHFRYGAESMPFLGYMGVYGCVAGWGLLRLRKWGATMFALVTCAYGLVVPALSLINYHSPFNIILAIPWAVLCCAPLFFTVRAWRNLN